LFRKEYLDRDKPLKLVSFLEIPREKGIECVAKIERDGVAREISGSGNGPVAAFVRALLSCGVEPFEVVSYSEHSLGTGAEAKAVAYFEIKSGAGPSTFGAATDTNIEIASLKAVLSALNRAGR
jgi:2-isopropylmalate synthase